VDVAGAWLQRLPTGQALWIGAAGIVLVSTLLRLWFEMRPSTRRLRASVHAFEGTLLALILAAMIALSFLQVLLRNFFDTSLLWIDPLLRHLVLWVGLLGAALASRSGRHINVDALSRLLSDAGLRIARAGTNLLAAVVTLLLALACFRLVRDEVDFARDAFLGLPVWSVQIVMPLALLMMSSRFLGHAVDASRGRGLRPPPPEVRG